MYDRRHVLRLLALLPFVAACTKPEEEKPRDPRRELLEEQERQQRIQRLPEERRRGVTQ